MFPYINTFYPSYTVIILYDFLLPFFIFDDQYAQQTKAHNKSKAESLFTNLPPFIIIEDLSIYRVFFTHSLQSTSPIFF